MNIKYNTIRNCRRNNAVRKFDELAAAGAAAGWSVLSTTQGTLVDKDYSRRVQRAPRNKRLPR